MTFSAAERRITYGLFAVLFALHAWAVSVGFRHGFLPGNEFRQTHTAISALFIQREHNFSLAYPTPLLGKPWSIPYEFPLYQWSVVGISNASGLSLTESARLLSWACLYAALPAIFLLVSRLGVEGPRRLLVLALVLTCPLYIFYARAFLIETMALMFSLWFLAAYLRAVEQRSLAWLAVANLAGAGAGLVKVTTFLLYLLPAAIWSARHLWQARPWSVSDRRECGRRLGWMAAACAVPFGITLWWIRHADAIKALNLSGRQLMSDAMNGYHFGSVQLRLSPALWRTFWSIVSTNVAPAATLAIFAGVALIWGGRWRRWILGCVLVFAAGPLVFPNLYSWHEYYFSANSVLLMTAIGLSLCGLLESRAPRWLALGLIVGLVSIQLRAYFVNLYPGQVLDLKGGSGLTEWLRDGTDTSDVLLIAGEDWAPMIPYYSQRRALMFRRGMDFDGAYVPAALASLAGESAPLLILANESRNNPLLLRRAAQEFQIDSSPIARWEDTVVYARPDVTVRLARQFRARPYGGVILLGKAQEEADSFQFVEHLTGKMSAEERAVFAHLAPEPVRFSCRFPFGLVPLDGRPMLIAHPNSRLVFAVARGRHRVVAEFGIMPNAYEHVPPPEVPPKGVTFSVVRARADGTGETVFQRFLNPTLVPTDRGTQRLEVTVDIADGDELALLTGPGPTADYNRTWAYWAEARIE